MDKVVAKNKKILLGFTLIELLVVIAIIGILSTLAIVALSNARAKSRDSKRVADIKQISTALELYYADNSSYPTIITPGNSLVSPDGTKVYMGKIPNNPTPRNDGNCPDTNYGYTYVTSTNTYYISSCLGNTSGGLSAGGIALKSDAPLTNDVLYGLIGWWKFDEGSGNTVIDSSGNSVTGTFNSSPIWNNQGNCKSGNCLKFNADSWITMTIPNNFTTMSASAWVNIVGDGTAGINGIMNGKAFRFYIDNSGTPAVQMTLAGNFYGGCSFAGLNVARNGWHFVAFSYTGSNIYLYVDQNTASCSVSGALANDRDGEIGGIQGMSAYLFNGLIDDVRIYNRALSAAEFSILYNATK